LAFVTRHPVEAFLFDPGAMSCHAPSPRFAGKSRALSRSRAPDDPELLAAKADLAAAVEADREARREAVQSDPELREIKLREAIKKEAEADPPLTSAARPLGCSTSAIRPWTWDRLTRVNAAPCQEAALSN
jgi:hypothetical protein